MATYVPPNGVLSVNFALEYVMKAQMSSIRIALSFLQPRHCMEVDGKPHAPAVLPPERHPVLTL
jgi:hypothetical protein